MEAKKRAILLARIYRNSQMEGATARREETERARQILIRCEIYGEHKNRVAADLGISVRHLYRERREVMHWLLPEWEQPRSRSTGDDGASDGTTLTRLLARRRDLAFLKTTSYASVLIRPDDERLPPTERIAAVEYRLRRFIDSIGSNLPVRQSIRLREIVLRADIRGIPHKTVANELSLSMRQFYRLRHHALNELASVLERHDPGVEIIRDDSGQEVLYSAADLMARTGRVDEARRLVCAIEAATPDHWVRRTAQFGLLSILANDLKSAREASQSINAFLARTRDGVSPAAKAHVPLLKAAVYSAVGSSGGVEAFDQALQSFRNAALTRHDRRVMVRGLVAFAMLLFKTAGADSALPHLFEAREVLRADNSSQHLESNVENALAEAYGALPGFAPNVEQCALRSLRYAEIYQSPVQAAHAYILLAHCAALSGRSSDAARLLASAQLVQLPQAAKAPYLMRAVDVAQAMDDIDEAESYMRRVRDIGEIPVNDWMGLTLRAAEISIARGHYGTAEERWRELTSARLSGMICDLDGRMHVVGARLKLHAGNDAEARAMSLRALQILSHRTHLDLVLRAARTARDAGVRGFERIAEDLEILCNPQLLAECAVSELSA